MAVTVFLLECSVYITELLTIVYKNVFNILRMSSYMKFDSLLTPPLLANLLIDALETPSRQLRQ